MIAYAYDAYAAIDYATPLALSRFDAERLLLLLGLLMLVTSAPLFQLSPYMLYAMLILLLRFAP